MSAIYGDLGLTRADMDVLLDEPRDKNTIKLIKESVATGLAFAILFSAFSTSHDAYKTRSFSGALSAESIPNTLCCAVAGFVFGFVGNAAVNWNEESFCLERFSIQRKRLRIYNENELIGNQDINYLLIGRSEQNRHLIIAKLNPTQREALN